MKNFCIIFLSFVIIIVTAIGFSGRVSSSTPPPADYLRIHIRADSNEQADQAVKYHIRDKVVEYLTPLVADCSNKKAATAAVKGKLDEIAAIAKNALREQGFSYGARAELKKEKFPTRAYGEYLLPAGEYTALVLYLGSGSGDNWWCVVYPPLCFTGGENVVYKSKIKEIIARFYQK